MRIAIIDRFFSQVWYSWKLCEALSKLPKKNLSVIFYAQKRVLKPAIRNHVTLKYIWSPFFYPLELLKETLRDRPNIAHIQFELSTFGHPATSLLFPLLLLLLRIANVKVVVTIHGVFARYLLRDKMAHYLLLKKFPVLFIFLNVFFIFLYKATDYLSHAIIVHSKVFREWLVGDYDVHRGKIHVVPHGVDPEIPQIFSVKGRKWSKLLDGKVVILNFGVLSPRKGLELLIQGFASLAKEIPEAILIIAGPEPTYYRGYKNSLEKLVYSLNLQDKVIFTGFITDEEVHILYSKADIVVLPYTISISASGPLSLAIQHRKPVIVTRTGFFAEELLDGIESIFVPPNDKEALVKAMRTLILDNTLKKRMSDALNIKAKNMSWNVIAEETFKIYYLTLKEN